jgi:drug/metabolite transporter (DMT)-like permease
MNKKLLYVSLFSLFWALNIILSRFILKGNIHPLSYTFQSLLYATLIILGYVFLTKPEAIKAGSKSSHFGAIISGIIGGGLGNIFAFYGLQLSTATNYGFLIKMAGLFNVILAYFVLSEPIKKLKAILLLAMVAGAYLLSTSGQLISPHLGDIFILLGALGYGAASVLNRKVLKKDMDPDVVSLYRAGFGFLISIIATQLIIGISFNSHLLLLILLSGFLNALIYIFLNKTLQVASSSYLAMLSMSVPVMVAIMGVLIFKEGLAPIQWLGGSLIVIGGILTEAKKVAHHD